MAIIEPGADAPDFELPSHNDENIKLSSYRGKKVMLVFYPLDFTPT
jgi:peroxiredoxin Q/BCP